mgnify:CR=1 FL=1
MSHMRTYTTSIRSIPALALACQRLNLTFHENQKTAQYYGKQLDTCEHAISIPDTNYQVGVVKNVDATYALRADFFDSQVRKAIGENGLRLVQEHHAAVVLLEAQSAYGAELVEEKRHANGTIEIILLER